MQAYEQDRSSTTSYHLPSLFATTASTWPTVYPLVHEEDLHTRRSESPLFQTIHYIYQEPPFRIAYTFDVVVHKPDSPNSATVNEELAKAATFSSKFFNTLTGLVSRVRLKLRRRYQTEKHGQFDR